MYNTRGKNYIGQHILWKIKITIRITVGRVDTSPETHMHKDKCRAHEGGHARKPNSGSQNNKARIFKKIVQ